MNLSNGDREHVPELAGNDLLLETLIELMKDDNPENRRNAAVALFNVACADQNTVRLARYKDGVVLEALTQIVSTYDANAGPNDEARTNAAETLFNMSCSEVKETTDRMADHCGLLEALAVTLRSPSADVDVKMYCAATLRRMAEITYATAPSQGALLSALVRASAWTQTACVAEAFRAQAEAKASRPIMARHHGLLNALSRMALSVGGGETERVRMAAVEALEMMAREESTRTMLAHNEGVMMALTRASYGINPAGSISRTSHGGIGPADDGSTDVDNQGHMVQMALKNLVASM